jgi:hypothetical protein
MDQLSTVVMTAICQAWRIFLQTGWAFPATESFPLPAPGFKTDLAILKSAFLMTMIITK